MVVVVVVVKMMMVICKLQKQACDPSRVTMSLLLISISSRSNYGCNGPLLGVNVGRMILKVNDYFYYF